MLKKRKQQATFEQLSKSARLGSVKSQYGLALTYALGEDVARDISKAVFWYQEAGKKNHPDAQYELAVLFLYGDGVSKDYGKGLWWLRKAARSSQKTPCVAEARGLLADGYANGLFGLSLNFRKALQWYKAGSRLSSKNSYLAGQLYLRGMGCRKSKNNKRVGLKLITRAADEGFREAREFLATHGKSEKTADQSMTPSHDAQP